MYLFIFGCIGSSLLRTGFSLVMSGGYSSLWCAGFSLQSTDSRCAGFSSCGAQAEMLPGMWDLPGPGIEPMSPALAGRFLTTVPPRKSLTRVFNLKSLDPLGVPQIPRNLEAKKDYIFTNF